MMKKSLLLEDLSKVNGGDFYDCIRVDNAFGVWLISRIIGDIVFISTKDFNILKNKVENEMGWKEPINQEDFIVNYCINNLEYEKYDDFNSYRRTRRPYGYKDFVGGIRYFY